MSAYVADIAAQPEALRALLDAPPPPVAAQFERIVVSGMGASHYANYGLWHDLAAAGLPAWWVETGELLHGVDGLVTGRCLVWLTSQSGESGEVVALLDRLTGRSGVTVLGLTNDPEGTLARRADLVVDLHAGPEHTVSTRTFVNSVAANHLVSGVWCGRTQEEVLRSLEEEQRAVTATLPGDLDRHLAEAEHVAERVRRLVIVARGRVFAAAATGALTIKEAAKFHAEAMTANQFRHGPIEMAGPDLSVVLLPGEDTADSDRQLAEELLAHRSHVIWVGDCGPRGADRLHRPAETPVGRSLTDVLPLQLLSVALARRAGVEPGEFVHAQKVTSRL
jgi:glutamine---fructose-6-phosphate transaminase (isomerizing)